ncbi:MAG: hypothetical protein ACTSQY_00335 [Candidatus Odinarchaeia archaeon]|nr:MAG: hypothetical protein [Lokiarchaeota virus Fenrir Meg22_1012]URC17246.1 MAG: hypothetical protein [Lokiarchaeota virus Fenrir Meg22_1214]
MKICLKFFLYKILDKIRNLISDKKITATLKPLNNKIDVEVLDDNYKPIKLTVPLYKIEETGEEIYLFGDLMDEYENRR